MVAKREIQRKGRVLKAAMAREQDGRPSLDFARYDGVFHTAWVIRYRNGLAAICSFYPDSDIRNGQGHRADRLGALKAETGVRFPLGRVTP